MNDPAEKKKAHCEIDATEAPDTAQIIRVASPPPPNVGHMDTVEPADSAAIKGLAGAIGMMDAIETLDYIPQDPPPGIIIGTMGAAQFVPPLKSEGVGRAVEEAIIYIWKGYPPSKWVFSELERIRRLLEPHGYRFVSNEALSKLARRACPKPEK